MSVSHVPPSHDAHGQPKRRKVRKGTHSCWECKRRKMKCIFDPRISSTSCNGCRRRGSPCIGQEFSEGQENVHEDIGTSGDGTFFDGRTHHNLTPESTIMESSQFHKFSEVRLSSGSSLQYDIIVPDGFLAISPNYQK
jgi:hypothetical protein